MVTEFVLRFEPSPTQSQTGYSNFCFHSGGFFEFVPRFKPSNLKLVISNFYFNKLEFRDSHPVQRGVAIFDFDVCQEFRVDLNLMVPPSYF